MYANTAARAVSLLGYVLPRTHLRLSVELI